MHDHDIDGPGGDARVPERHPVPEIDPAVDPALRAGRPEPLVPTGLLHLQRAAGNAGVQRLVQRSVPDADEEASPVHRVVSEPGEALDTGTRAIMEDRLGQGFGDVRVHRDADAAASARHVAAHAYTVGNHVVFGEGRYQPETDDGRRTLAHELTHVVQQREGPVDGTPAAGGIRVSDPSDRFEREAEATAARAMTDSGPDAPPVPQAVPPVQRESESVPGGVDAVQRQAQGEEEDEEAGAAAPEGPQTEAPASAEASEAEEEETDSDVSRLAVQREEAAEEEESEETPA